MFSGDLEFFFALLCFCLRINRAVQNKHLATGMTGLFGVFFYLLSQKTCHYGFGRSRRKVWHAGLNVAFIKLYCSLVCVLGREGSLPGSHATDVFCYESARASGVTHCALSASLINRPSNPLAAEAAGRVSHAHL